MKAMLAALLALLILTGSSHAQSKLQTFNATAVEVESSELMQTWGEGCSFYCAILSATERASSTLPPRNRLRYDAGQAHDFNLNTAWVEGSADHGIGQFLEYIVEPTGDSQEVTGLTILNGYRKSRELWQDNSRVKRLKMYVNGKPYGIINLQDAYNYQTVEVGHVKLKPQQKTVLKFEILEVYKGRKYSDTAITEIELEGCCAH